MYSVDNLVAIFTLSHVSFLYFIFPIWYSKELFVHYRVALTLKMKMIVSNFTAMDTYNDKWFVST